MYTITITVLIIIIVLLVLLFGAVISINKNLSKQINKLDRSIFVQGNDIEAIRHKKDFANKTLANINFDMHTKFNLILFLLSRKEDEIKENDYIKDSTKREIYKELRKNLNQLSLEYPPF